MAPAVGVPLKVLPSETSLVFPLVLAWKKAKAFSLAWFVEMGAPCAIGKVARARKERAIYFLMMEGDEMKVSM